MKLSRFTRSALGTLIWSENDWSNMYDSDNPRPFLDDAPGTHYANGADVPIDDFDFDEEGLLEFSRDCESFWSAVIDLGLSSHGETEQYADDFVLTRNGHGAGFWDGDWPAPADTKLTAISKTYGNVSLYRGDDGRIYFGN